MRLAVIISLIIGTIAIIFAVINPMAVDINFVFFRIERASLPLVLICTLLLGVLIGYLISIPARIKSGRRTKALERAAVKTAAAEATPEPAESGDGPMEEADPNRI